MSQASSILVPIIYFLMKLKPSSSLYSRKWASCLSSSRLVYEASYKQAKLELYWSPSKKLNNKSYKIYINCTPSFPKRMSPFYNLLSQSDYPFSLHLLIHHCQLSCRSMAMKCTLRAFIYTC